MNPKSFLAWVALSCVLLGAILGFYGRGYISQQKGANSGTSIPQQHAVTGTSGLDSGSRVNDENREVPLDDAAGNKDFVAYMRLSSSARLSYECSKLSIQKYADFCKQEKIRIPTLQKQQEIFQKLARGGDISLCDGFSVDKNEQDRCRLDFVFGRLIHPTENIPPISTASTGNTLTLSGMHEPSSQPVLKDCSLVEKYGLLKRCLQGQEAIRQMDLPNRVPVPQSSLDGNETKAK